MALREFKGEGIYDGYPIVKAKVSHVDYLQNNLRDADVRECIIHGATPFRALMAGIREPNGESYTVMVDKKPALMFGCNPIYSNMIGKIWALGTYDIEKIQRKFLKWCNPVVDYYQKQYYQLENVVPADHANTLSWLDFVGFEILDPPVMINGFAVLRFVRCKGEEILVNKEYSPVFS